MLVFRLILPFTTPFVNSVHRLMLFRPFGGDDEGLGCMFRVLSERIEGDLTAHFSALASSNAKSGDPLGSDLVIDDTQYK